MLNNKIAALTLLVCLGCSGGQQKIKDQYHVDVYSGSQLIQCSNLYEDEVYFNWEGNLVIGEYRYRSIHPLVKMGPPLNVNHLGSGK